MAICHPNRDMPTWIRWRAIRGREAKGRKGRKKRDGRKGKEVDRKCRQCLRLYFGKRVQAVTLRGFFVEDNDGDNQLRFCTDYFASCLLKVATFGKSLRTIATRREIFVGGRSLVTNGNFLNLLLNPPYWRASSALVGWSKATPLPCQGHSL